MVDGDEKIVVLDEGIDEAAESLSACCSTGVNKARTSK